METADSARGTFPKRPLVITINLVVWTCRLSRSRRRGRGRGRGRPPWRMAAAGAAASVRGATRLLHGGGGDGCVEERSPSARDSKRTTRDATADGPCPPARAARRAALTQGRGAPVGERARAPTEEAHPPNRERRGRPLAGVASSCPRRPPPLGLEVARATVAALPTGRRMRALDDGRDDSRSLMMMI